LVPAPHDIGWVRRYLRNAFIVDLIAGVAAGLIALEVRFSTYGHLPTQYLALTAYLPLLWVAAVALARGYDARLIGVGADEFRRVINAGLGLTSAIAILSYANKANVSRAYVLIAMPCLVCFDLAGRYRLRKRLHRQRAKGACMSRAVAVGHLDDIAHLANELRRAPYHGLTVVAACLAGPGLPANGEIVGIRVYGGLSNVAETVRHCGADTVALLACPEMSATRLQRLAWELEKTDTEVCLAPALLDVAGPRTIIRPVAGLSLLYVDHPDLSGVRHVIKGVFDKVAAAVALVLLGPLLLAIAVAIRFEDGGPVLFSQVRVGKDGRLFRLYKFRTMVPDAEQRKATLASHNEGAGVLFKMRKDPRVTRIGAWLRRWSLDELPQFINVLLGPMSLVGPRPALPEEAVKYGHLVRRRLVVRPGITGLWQIHGRSDLTWEEAVRLDLRYVENWSLALDLLILWKTWPAVARGRGAY
jgi:exopolysaccharide biosynthesis polyprenyl glycosylphosphotransferase